MARKDIHGRDHHGFEYDLDYAPPLPKGAVRGNVRLQDFCTMCHVPRYFFVDIDRVCVQCGTRFVFRASEQKHWYETLKFHFDSVPTRCIDCRRLRRTDRALHRELAAARAAARERSQEPAAQLALAEAIVRYFQRNDEGSLEEAIAASRKARRLFRGHRPRDALETLFWEAMSHALAGRPARARPMLVEFLDSGARGKRLAPLRKEAERWLAANPAA